MPRLSGSLVKMLFEGYNKIYLKNQNGVSNGVSVFTGPLHNFGGTKKVQTDKKRLPIFCKRLQIQ
ncbi:MAG: hypothetical protein B5M56_00650 [Desulfococcus sp. 4484_241]|nr:MAG: hypothetical protein B5M56_00650 [Desulfococcus sp. 4484_241]